MSKTIKVVVCAGHGGNNSTPGKRSPDGTYEWNYNDQIVRAFITELGKYAGVAVLRVDDATGKKDIPLETRTDLAKAWGADYHISFHNNAYQSKWGTHTGTETLYYTKDPESKRLAEVVQNAMVRAWGLRNRGLKTGDPFWVLRSTEKISRSAVIAEAGFMDSSIDIEKLRSKEHLARLGREVAKDFAQWKKLPYKTDDKPTAPPKQETSEVLYRVRETWADSASQLGAFRSLDTAKALADQNPGFEVYDLSGNIVYDPKNVYGGKRLVSSIEGLKYYNKPTWDKASVVGTLPVGTGFPTVLDKVMTDGIYQYKVQNSKGQVFYVTAGSAYVKLV